MLADLVAETTRLGLGRRCKQARRKSMSTSTHDMQILQAAQRSANALEQIAKLLAEIKRFYELQQQSKAA
jgi:hypothetical protein